MGSRIRLFFNVISNSFNPNGYEQIIDARKPGEITTLVNSKRKINQKRISRVINGKIKKITN